MLKGIIAAAAMASLAVSPAGSNLTPIRLHAGENPITNIAGDGRGGGIFLFWRENGNAWGYDIFTVVVGNSIATVEGKDQFTDSPHTGEDVITSVRFARGQHNSRETTFALVARRKIVESVPDPAQTTIEIYALTPSAEPIGTPYEFVKVNELHPKRYYCNADMALKTELNFPLARTYDGGPSIDGC